MKEANLAKKIFRSFDLFSTSQFLRFQGEGEYKTASGGICSLIVIVVFMTLFMSTAIQTVNMQIISWTSTSTLEFDPSETNISINPPNNPFMFAVKLLGINLNDNVRFFDVFLVERTYIKGMYETTPKVVEMVPCTSQHFSLTNTIKQSTSTLGVQTWMCPPIGYNFKVKGKPTSAEMNLLQVRLTKCNATKYPSRPCASDALLDTYEAAFEQFIVALYFINPLINPGDQDYLSYYIEDKNYFKFTRKLGSDCNGRIEEYKIETDMSLLPYAQNKADSGVIITETFQTIAFQVTNDRYASFFFMKSAKSTSYSRSFNKLDQFFSYVGGLVGTILGLMFIIVSFTNMAYELELAGCISRYTEDKLNDFGSFNLLSYSLFVIYSIGKHIGLGKSFKGMQQADQCSEEAAKQLDVQLLFERLLFFQRATEAMLDEHQLQGLHLHRLDTLKQIQKRRKRYVVNHVDSSDDEQPQAPALESQIQNNNATNYASSTSNPQLIVFQSNQNEKIDENNPSRNQLKHKEPDLDNNEKVIRKLREQAQRGNKVSKKILQGIIKEIKETPSQAKLLDNSSQVIKVDPMQFQFIN